MKELLALSIVAAVIEAVWEGFKPAWPAGLVKLKKQAGIPVDRLGVMLLAVAACSALKFDLFQASGVPFAIPYLGTFLTGILGGRISNFWHDLLGLIDGIRRDKKPIEVEPGL